MNIMIRTTLWLATLFALFHPASALAQRMYIVDHESQAELTVFITERMSEADLVVFKEQYPSRAKGNDGYWFFESFPSRADKRIFISKYRSRAELIICFTQYRSRAGWRKQQKKHLLY